MSKKGSSIYTCVVNLDNTSGVYSPDELISGHVLVGASDVITLQQCIIWCYGRSVTSWKTKKGNKYVSENLRKASAFCDPESSLSPSSCSSIFQIYESFRSPRTKKSSEMFFCYRLDLLSQPPPSSAMFLFGESANSSIHNCCSAVSITFRGDKLLYFVFRLPAHLPSSFHLPKGHSCQAKISFGLRLQVRLLSSLARLPKELRVDRAFLVNSPLDLSMQPLLQNSVNLHKEFSLFDAINRPESIRRGSGEGKHMPPCTNDVNGLVACDLALNKTGFVPGESILVTATITYKSSSPLTAAQLSLIQRVSLYDRAAGNHVECVRLFASVLSSSSSSSRSKPKSWKRSNNTSMDNLGVVLSHYTEIIHVPPLPPSYSRDPSNNWLIAIDYSVFVSSVVFGHFLGLRLRLLRSHKDIREFQMSIPITIGTNPTLDTSFDGSQISSCLAWFDYSSGFIFEQVSEEDALYACPVYRYYQPIVQSKGLPPVPANTSRQLSSQKISAANPVSSFRANSSSPILRETLYFDDDLDDANVDGFYSGISTDTILVLGINGCR